MSAAHRLRALVLAAAACALPMISTAQVPPADSSQACVSGPMIVPPAGTEAPFVRADVRALAEKVTCYCGCPHLQVSKCYCGTAEAIRADFARRLDGGQDAEAVLSAYVAEHGLSILAVPPRRGFHWIIWIGPPVLLLLGATAAWLAGRRWSRPGAAPELAPQPLSPEQEERYRAALRRAVEEP
jgi:cytochrome c-type biogenesis protein CcmH